MKYKHKKCAAPNDAAHFLWNFNFTLPGKVSVDSENGKQNDFPKQHWLQGFEEVGFEVIDGDDKAHMRRREHLSGNAEGHSHTCKIQAASLHSGDNRHDDGYMSL